MSAVDRARTAGALPAGQWVVDSARSSVTFAIKHMLFSTVNGRFGEFEGTLEVDSAARASGSVQVASIDTGDRVRDEHLLSSADFFDVASHPTIDFRSTRVEQLDGARLRVTGELTMRGHSREIRLEGEIESIATQDDGGRRAELLLHGELERNDFGLSWNQTLDTGGVLLGGKVKIALEIAVLNAATLTA